MVKKRADDIDLLENRNSSTAARPRAEETSSSSPSKDDSLERIFESPWTNSNDNHLNTEQMNQNDELSPDILKTILNKSELHQQRGEGNSPADSLDEDIFGEDTPLKSTSVTLSEAPKRIILSDDEEEADF